MGTWDFEVDTGCTGALVLLLALLQVGVVAGPLRLVLVCLLILSSFFSPGWVVHMDLPFHSLTVLQYTCCCRCGAILCLCPVLGYSMRGDSHC